MKHDIYKQISVDILPLLLFDLIQYNKLFSIKHFEQSIIRKSLLATLGYILYYQFIQPYIVNILPDIY
jgi:hypothetical protein